MTNNGDIKVFIDTNTPDIIGRMLEENLSIAGNSVNSGKKLRGNLTLLVADALGGVKKTALDYAAAVEFIHAGSLEHDDVLDGHDVRRGMPTGAILEGIQKAILSGDIMFCAANRLASEKGNQAAVDVANTMQNTLDGVLKELNLDSIIKNAMVGKLEKDLYNNIMDRKTGTLFSCASKFGSMSADVGVDVQELMANFGMVLGRAYQISDDLVDIIEMGNGTKEITPLNVIGLVPALLNYESSIIKRLPMMMLRKNFDVTSLFGIVSELDIESKMKMDISKCLAECNVILDNVHKLYEPKNSVSFGLLREYPNYAVNKMLDEVGESL